MTNTLPSEDTWAAAAAAVAELSRAAYNVGAILPSIGLDLTSTWAAHR